MTNIALVAGEASGDQIAAQALAGLRQQFPMLHARGIGGPAMQAQGFSADWPSDLLAVNGYAEVLRHLPRLLSIRKKLAQSLLQNPPQLFMGIDAPDFNLGLEEQLKAAQIKTVHFVSPSIWAWRGERIHRIKRSVDHMLCLFPFEPEIYQQAGVRASYVGHPFADQIPLQIDRVAAKQALGIAKDTEVLAVLPGSRMSELHYIAPTFIATMKNLLQKKGALHFVVPMAGPAQVQRWQSLLNQQGASYLPITTLERNSHAALAAADAALVASGTATLECALFKLPMVIAYKLSRFSYWMMRNKGYLPYIGLPNILAKDWLVPEFIQDAATPDALTDACLQQMDDMRQRAKLEQYFSELHTILKQNTGQKVAEVLAQYLD